MWHLSSLAINSTKLICWPSDPLSCAPTAVVALLTSFQTLAQLANVGYLFVVCMIAGIVLWRRYYQVSHAWTAAAAKMTDRLHL